MGLYVMALVLVAGILAVSGIAGYVSGQKERGAENAVDFKDDGAGTAWIHRHLLKRIRPSWMR